MDGTFASLLIHIPAVTAWVGLVMFDVFLCFTPGLAPGQRTDLIGRTRWLTIALAVAILATGIWQTVDNPFLRADSWSSLEKLRDTTDYGKALFVKHIFVIATFVISLVVRFWLVRGGQAPQALPARGAGSSAVLDRRVAIACAANLAACLGVLLSTARMTIELH